MRVDAIPAAPSRVAGTDKPRAGKSALGKLDYNAFLRLLVAQLNNQDPTKPLDSTQYLAQLASYANVEQNIRANSKLDAVLNAVHAAHADSLLGRTVQASGGGPGGKVTGYEVKDDGVVLTLEGGGRVPLAPGLEVRAP